MVLLPPPPPSAAAAVPELVLWRPAEGAVAAAARARTTPTAAVERLRASAGNAAAVCAALCALGDVVDAASARAIVEGLHATKAVVMAMRAHPQDDALQQVAVAVLGHLAAASEDEDEIEGEGEGEGEDKVGASGAGAGGSAERAAPNAAATSAAEQRNSVAALILREAGAATVIATLRAYAARTTALKLALGPLAAARDAGATALVAAQVRRNGAVVHAAIDALAAIASDSEVAEVMLEKQELAEAVSEAAEAVGTSDAAFAASCATLVAVASFARAAVAREALVRGGGFALLLTCADRPSASAALARSAARALRNLAGGSAAQAQLRELGGVPVFVSLLAASLADREVTEDVLRALAALVVDDELSACVAAVALPTAMRAVDRHAQEPAVLGACFAVLRRLTFTESNVERVIEAGAVPRVVAAAARFAEDAPFLAQCLRTLETLATASPRGAEAVADEGGIELAESAREAHADSEEVQHEAASALASLSVAMRAVDTASHAARAVRLARSRAAASGAGAGAMMGATAAGADATGASSLARVVVEHRGLLRAGKLLKMWTKGTAMPAHVLVAADGRSIAWQEPRAPYAQVRAVELRSLSGVRAGLGAGHARGALSLGAPCDAACAFALACDRGGDVSLEASSEKERDAFVAAFAALLQSSKEEAAAPR